MRFAHPTGLFISRQRQVPARPIRWIDARLRQPMKSRMRPIRHASDEAMFDRIEMHIIHVRRVIGIVADLVFPEAALPDRRFTACKAGSVTPVRTFIVSRHRPCHQPFDPSPAHAEIRIAGRQGPDRMQVIRQQNPGVDGKWVRFRTRRMASCKARRNASSVSMGWRRYVTTVKKYVAPATFDRR